MSAPLDLKKQLSKAEQHLANNQGQAALTALKPLAQQHTDNARLNKCMGCAYILLKNHAQAKRHLQKALPEFTQDPIVLGSLGVALSRLEEFEQALPLLTQAVELDPSSHWFILEKGAAHQKLEDLEAAQACYYQALELNPNSVSALYNLSSFITFTPDHPWIERLNRLAQPDHLPEELEQQGWLFYTLGKVYQDLGDLEQAFSWYKKANDLLYPTRTDAVDLAQLYFFYKNYYTPDITLQLRANQGLEANSEIFICGQSRSGKSLVESLLACHPQVTAAGEHKKFRALAGGKLAADGSATRYLEKDPQEHLRDAQRYLEERDWPATKWVTNTLPDNIHALNILGSWLPKTPIIFITRDLNDLGLANYFKYYNNGNASTFDLKQCGRYIYFYEALIDLWIEVLPNPCIKLRYEDLVKHPAAVSKKLYEFVGLDWQPEYFKVLQEKRGYSEHLAPHQSLDTPAAIRADFVGWSQPYAAYLKPLQEGYQQAESLLGAPSDTSITGPSKKAEVQRTPKQAFARALKQASFDKAFLIAAKLHEHFPGKLEYLRWCGISASLVGQHQEAIRCLEEGAGRCPDDLSWQANLLRARLRADDLKAASKQLDRIQQRFGDSDVVKRMQLEVFLANPSQNKKKLQALQPLLLQLLQHTPEDAELVGMQASFDSLAGDYSAAVAGFQKAQALFQQQEQQTPEEVFSPQLTQLLVDWAGAELRAGHADQATERLFEACQLHPYSLATVKAWALLQTTSLQSKEPWHQELGGLYQKLAGIWRAYKEEELEYAFGDFNLPYQGFEPLHLPGARPTQERLASYALDQLLPKGARALDLGCNHGYLLLGLADQLSHADGFDISEVCIQVGQALVEHLGYQHIHLSAQSFSDFIAAPHEPYDLVIACAVHEWIGLDLSDFGQHLFSLCKPGGFVLLESQGIRETDSTEPDFVQKAEAIAKAGFSLVRQGSLCDDGIHYREFWILERNKNSSV